MVHYNIFYTITNPYSGKEEPMEHKDIPNEFTLKCMLSLIFTSALKNLFGDISHLTITKYTVL